MPPTVSNRLDDGVEVLGPLQTCFLIFKGVTNSLRALKFSNWDTWENLKHVKSKAQIAGDTTGKCI